MSERSNEVAEYLFRELPTIEEYRSYVAELPEFQPAAPPLTRERIEECVLKWNCVLTDDGVKGLTTALFAALSAPVPWYDSANKLPAKGQSMWWCTKEYPDCVMHGLYQGHPGNLKGCLWTPVTVPAPPVEEESPCVREFREKALGNVIPVEAAIEIVKRHEAKGVAEYRVDDRGNVSFHYLEAKVGAK